MKIMHVSLEPIDDPCLKVKATSIQEPKLVLADPLDETVRQNFISHFRKHITQAGLTHIQFLKESPIPI